MPQHPNRLLPLQGATNFRDLGGYPGEGGRRLRWGRLYRSDHLADLTLADQARLAEIGLARSFDFRGVNERAARAYQLPGVQQHTLAIEPSVVQQMQAMTEAGGTLTAPLVADLMRSLYRQLVNDHAHRFAELLGHVVQADAPLVFHCTAGKDRTGLAAALILLALGVPRDLVMADYLLTNQHFRHPPLPDSDTPPEVLAVLWRVQPDFLEAALHEVDTTQGGLDRYLSDRLGLGPAERATLAERYLEPA